VFTTRSRQHVVIARLNDKEYEIYERVLTRVRKEFNVPKNDSEALRLALRIIEHKLTEEAMQYFYEHCLDIGVEL